MRDRTSSLALAEHVQVHQMKWHLRNGPKKFQPPTGERAALLAAVTCPSVGTCDAFVTRHTYCVNLELRCGGVAGVLQESPACAAPESCCVARCWRPCARVRTQSRPPWRVAGQVRELCAGITSPHAWLIVSGASGATGDRQCPCFCSERDSDDFAPYWNANFGFDYVDGTACATPCRTDTTLLSNCAEHVDYRYCGRRMNNTVPATTDAGALADDIIASLDGTFCVRVLAVQASKLRADDGAWWCRVTSAASAPQRMCSAARPI